RIARTAERPACAPTGRYGRAAETWPGRRPPHRRRGRASAGRCPVRVARDGAPVRRTRPHHSLIHTEPARRRRFRAALPEGASETSANGPGQQTWHPRGCLAGNGSSRTIVPEPIEEVPHFSSVTGHRSPALTHSFELARSRSRLALHRALDSDAEVGR